MVPVGDMILCMNLLQSPFLIVFRENVVGQNSGFQGMLGRIFLHGRCCIFTTGIVGSYQLFLPLDVFEIYVCELEIYYCNLDHKAGR